MVMSPKRDRHDGPGWRQRAGAYRELAATLGPAGKERMLAIAASFEEKAAEAEREHEARRVGPNASSRHRPGASSHHEGARAEATPTPSPSPRRTLVTPRRRAREASAP